MPVELCVELVKALAYSPTLSATLFAPRMHIAAVAEQVGRFKYGDFEFELN